jgi:hypothetical protein
VNKSGANVMTTNFGDFDRFSAEKMAIFLEKSMMLLSILGIK